MADSIDDKFGEEKPQDKQETQKGLEAKVEAPDEDRGIVGGVKTLCRVAVTGAMLYGTYGIVGAASLLSAFGNSVGYLIEKRKNKEKIRSKDLLKETSTGGVLGVAATGLYGGGIETAMRYISPFVPGVYYLPQIVKTLAFNPIMLSGYQLFYQTYTHLRDKVGALRSVGSVFTGKIFSHLKDAYNEEIKPNFGKKMKSIMKLMPIHFVNLNYVSSVLGRVGIGVGNDVLFRLFQKKEPGKDYQKSQRNYQTQQNVVPQAA